MPNKNTPNGFYMFMLEEQQRIKAQTKRAPSMHEMPGMCKDAWKNLSAAEKSRYDTLAKQEKARQRGGGNGDNYRRDNLREIIAYRRDPVAEKEKRRRHETDTMMKNWGNTDILDIVFHVIDFQVMYDERCEDHHLPLELGMVAFTLRDGLRKSLHTFINPGDAPQGNRHLAFRHSENTHQIPLNFEQGDKNYTGIWGNIQHFLMEEDSDQDEIPPLICLSDNTEIVESCLEFLHSMSGLNEPNVLHKIYCMEDLVAALIMKSGKSERRPVLSQIRDAILQNTWDYTSSIRCSYHEECDCSYCSLSIVQRYSFASFDILSNVLNFPLTKNHVPEEPEHHIQVTVPEAFGRSRGWNRHRDFDRGHPNGRGWGDENKSPPPFSTPQAQPQSPWRQQQQQQQQQHFRGGAPSFAATATATEPKRAWVPPSVGRFEIRLSDDEDDDDEDEDDVLRSTEVKSTSDQYHLKELRKPKTPSMFQSVSGEGGNRPSLATLGRGIRAPTVPTAGGFPPPGAVGPPGAFPALDAFPPLGFGRSRMPLAGQVPPPQGSGRGVRPMPTPGAVGRGRGRGRGLPPQI